MAGNIAWATVSRGPFSFGLVETGEIRAVDAVFITVPRERIDLQIVDMIPEGANVEPGDFLVQFDTAPLLEELEQEQDVLRQAEADLKSIETQQTSRMSELQTNLEMARYSMEAARLRVELMKYESRNTREDARIELRKEEIRYGEAEKNIEARKIMDYAERQEVLLRLEHAGNEVREMEERIERLRIAAPIRGMVVYREIGGWNAPKYKVDVGETVRSGEAVMTISDLSRMKMVLNVHEMDVDHLAVGQRAEVRLDAFPDSLFHGKIATIANLIEKEAQNWMPTSRPPSFEVTMNIDETSPILKPGMTAQAVIITDALDDVTTIPVGAVYENDEGETVVFTRESYPQPAPVVLGPRSDRRILVRDGLDGAEEVAWEPPEDGPFHKLGWFAEMERRRLEKMNLLAHLDTMEETGVTTRVDSLRKMLNTPDTISEEAARNMGGGSGGVIVVPGRGD